MSDDQNTETENVENTTKFIHSPGPSNTPLEETPEIPQELWFKKRKQGKRRKNRIRNKQHRCAYLLRKFAMVGLNTDIAGSNSTTTNVNDANQSIDGENSATSITVNPNNNNEITKYTDTGNENTTVMSISNLNSDNRDIDKLISYENDNITPNFRVESDNTNTNNINVHIVNVDIGINNALLFVPEQIVEPKLNAPASPTEQVTSELKIPHFILKNPEKPEKLKTVTQLKKENERVTSFFKNQSEATDCNLNLTHEQEMSLAPGPTELPIKTLNIHCGNESIIASEVFWSNVQKQRGWKVQEPVNPKKKQKYLQFLSTNLDMQQNLNQRSKNSQNDSSKVVEELNDDAFFHTKADHSTPIVQDNIVINTFKQQPTTRSFETKLEEQYAKKLQARNNVEHREVRLSGNSDNPSINDKPSNQLIGIDRKRANRELVEGLSADIRTVVRDNIRLNMNDQMNCHSEDEKFNMLMFMKGNMDIMPDD